MERTNFSHDCLCTLNRFIASTQNNRKCKTILQKRKRIQSNKLFINSRKKRRKWANIHCTEWAFGQLMRMRHIHRVSLFSRWWRSQSLFFSSLWDLSLSAAVVFRADSICIHFEPYFGYLAIKLQQCCSWCERMNERASWLLFYSTKIQFAINQKGTDFYVRNMLPPLLLLLLPHIT